MSPTTKLSAVALAVLAVSVPASQQVGEQSPPAAAQARFSAEQLEQLVAPIALHPDALLMQILSASTERSMAPSDSTPLAPSPSPNRTMREKASTTRN